MKLLYFWKRMPGVLRARPVAAQITKNNHIQTTLDSISTLEHELQTRYENSASILPTLLCFPVHGSSFGYQCLVSLVQTTTILQMERILALGPSLGHLPPGLGRQNVVLLLKRSDPPKYPPSESPALPVDLLLLSWICCKSERFTRTTFTPSVLIFN